MKFIQHHTTRLLIIEDDCFLNEAIGDILAGEGYVVDSAANGNEALEMLQANTYNTVLLDLSFHASYIQGIEVLKFLNLTNPQLPVIVISGRASDEEILQTVHAGAFSFLLKPVHDLYSLLEKVEEAVQKEKLTSNLAGPLVSTASGSCSIEGITSDMHIYVRQYLLYFERFVLDFKGVQLKIQVDSAFDTVQVHFYECNFEENMLVWLHEYLMFSQLPELNPICETKFSQEELESSVAALTEQVDQFAHHIVRAFKRLPIDTNIERTTDHETLFISPIKIKNRFQLQREDAQKRSFRVSALAAAKKALALLSKAKTIEAMSVILEFSEQFNLRALRNQILQLQYRYNELVNKHIDGLVSESEFVKQINEISNLSLFDLILDIENLPSHRCA